MKRWWDEPPISHLPVQSTCDVTLKGRRLQSSTRLVSRPLCSWRWPGVCCPWHHRSSPAGGRWSCWSEMFQRTKMSVILTSNPSSVEQTTFLTCELNYTVRIRNMVLHWSSLSLQKCLLILNMQMCPEFWHQHKRQAELHLIKVTSAVWNQRIK